MWRLNRSISHMIQGLQQGGLRTQQVARYWREKKRQTEP